MLKPDTLPKPYFDPEEGWSPESPTCRTGHHCEYTYGGVCFKHLSRKQQRNAYRPRHKRATVRT